MCHPIQFKTTTLPIKYATGRSPLRRGFFLISLALTCFVLPPPAQAQLPNIVAGDSQAQPISTIQTTSTALQRSHRLRRHRPRRRNTLLTGFYAYYKLNEASGAGALDAGQGARNLIQCNGCGTIGSVPGIFNTDRSFSGNEEFIRKASRSDFSPGSNH